MRTTPLLGISVPDADDVADVPTHLYTVATGLETHSIVRCTSATRPSSAVRFDGMVIFETDTKNELTWNATNAEWSRPWNIAWGSLGSRGHAQMNSGNIQSNITAVTDILGATLSFKGYAGRRYRGMTHGQGFCAGSGNATVYFNLDGVDVSYAWNYEGMTSQRRPIDGSYEFTVSATGTHTLKLRAAGSIAFAWDNIDQGRYFSVEDIGLAV
jgi:hypothetical protein